MRPYNGLRVPPSLPILFVVDEIFSLYSKGGVNEILRSFHDLLENKHRSQDFMQARNNNSFLAMLVSKYL